MSTPSHIRASDAQLVCSRWATLHIHGMRKTDVFCRNPAVILCFRPVRRKNKVLTRLPGGCGVARPKTSCLEVSQASCDSTYSPRTSGYRGRAFRSHGVENMSRNHGWDCMLLNKSNKKHALLQCLGKVPKSSRVPFFLTFQPKDFN